MLELALQQKFIDVIDNFAEENGVERRDLFKFVSNEYGRLPGSLEAAEVLKRAKENTKAGKHRPAEEVIADMRRIVASKKV